jgi:hypothetical protein
MLALLPFPVVLQGLYACHPRAVNGYTPSKLKEPDEPSESGEPKRKHKNHFTVEQIYEIHDAHADGEKQVAISERLGVTTGAIIHIVSGKSYPNLYRKWIERRQRESGNVD